MELSSARALGTPAGQVIDSPLREHAHRTAAAVVSMRDAYCSFQTEVVGQDALDLRAFPKSLDHPQALFVAGAVVRQLPGNNKTLSAIPFLLFFV